MIKKERGAPLKLIKLQALARRLPSSHIKMPQIKKEIRKRQSGYKGEQSIDYHLSFLPEKQYHILHDLRLQNQRGYFFQIDTLLLSPHFITIIEVKNYSQTITFDNDFHQLVQTSNQGDRRALKDPVSQMNRHIFQFKHWLREYKFSPAPIKPLILISNPSAIIETKSNPSYFRFISHIINVEEKVANYSLMHKAEVYSKQELRNLSKRLIKLDTPPEYDALQHFHIHPRELLRGVHCPACSHLPMKRMHGKWQCPACNATSKNAHIEALYDYSLLVRNTITNQQFCDFMMTPSRNTSHYLLCAMNLMHSGETKGRIYHLPPLEQFYFRN